MSSISFEATEYNITIQRDNSFQICVVAKESSATVIDQATASWYFTIYRSGTTASVLTATTTPANNSNQSGVFVATLNRDDSDSLSDLPYDLEYRIYAVLGTLQQVTLLKGGITIL